MLNIFRRSSLRKPLSSSSTRPNCAINPPPAGGMSVCSFHLCRSPAAGYGGRSTDLQAQALSQYGEEEK